LPLQRRLAMARPLQFRWSVDPLQCDHANGILQYCGVRSCLLLEARMVEHQEQGAHSSEAKYAADGHIPRSGCSCKWSLATTPRHREGVTGWDLVKAVLPHGSLCIQLQRSRAQSSHGMSSFRGTKERHDCESELGIATLANRTCSSDTMVGRERRWED